MEAGEMFELMKAWTAAHDALDKTATELRAAQAGHETALQCEREAWEKIAKFCGRETAPPKPPPVPMEARVVPAPTALTTAYAQPPATLLYQQPLDTRVGLYSGSNVFCGSRTGW